MLSLMIISACLHLILLSESRDFTADPRKGLSLPQAESSPPPQTAPRTHPGQGLLFVQGSLSFDGGVPGTIGEKGTAWKGKKWGC